MSFQFVKIHYGPCDSFHTIAHKPQKLYGIRDRLLRLGYRVNLRPMGHLNLCVIEMCNHEIFRCNINNLSFNTPYTKDKVCQRAVDAVLGASESFLRARSYLWTWTLIDDQIFSRNEYTSKDYWVDYEQSNPLKNVLDCANCCKILITKKTEDDLQMEREEKDKLRLAQFKEALQIEEEQETKVVIDKITTTDANLANMIKDLKIDVKSVLSENLTI